MVKRHSLSAHRLSHIPHLYCRHCSLVPAKGGGVITTRMTASLVAQPSVEVKPPQRPLGQPPYEAHFKPLGPAGPLDDSRPPAGVLATVIHAIF
jgi:hypothetical protein